MKNFVVPTQLRVRLSCGSRLYLDPVLSANGKLKPLYAVVDGKAVHHPEGADFLRYAKTASANFRTPRAERERNSQLKD